MHRWTAGSVPKEDHENGHGGLCHCGSICPVSNGVIARFVVVSKYSPSLRVEIVFFATPIDSVDHKILHRNVKMGFRLMNL
jgi:hypothetical protein